MSHSWWNAPVTRRRLVACGTSCFLLAGLGGGSPDGLQLFSNSHVAAAEPRAAAEPPAVEPLDEFSPAFLGTYRKVMEIEAEILAAAARYGVDPSLARAVCMYESGGNANLTSVAGAQGYFQVMPATYRLLGVKTNIEAGVKYLAQMVKEFGREDYALAAYNGGPGRVTRGRGMPLESLQYVMGVGAFRSVLKMHEPSVRAHARTLSLVRTKAGDDWWTVSDRLGLPVIQLKLHNPFLTEGRLKQGSHLVVHPAQPRSALFDVGPDGPLYRARVGDNYFNLAFAFGADLDLLRSTNDLWRLQLLPPGMVLTIPVDAAARYAEHRVRQGDTLGAIATAVGIDPWQIVRHNNLWDDRLEAGMVLRIPVAAPRPAAASAPAPAAPRFVTHRVTRGETLNGIARRYDTTIADIQRVNNLGRRTVIRVGERLRIPAR